ncbi:MAG: hypothetical protein HFJ12_02090 [Bacilli bacterium]|nr:hypothetical protein [Bacilli bacterium]
MDFIITFFRDVLDGPLYIVIAVIAGILICSCIGYLAERSIERKKERTQYEQEHFNVSANSNEENNIVVNEVILNEVSEESAPMETVSVDNVSDIDVSQQAIPEISDMEVSNINNDGNRGVNSTQNVGK